MIANFTAITLCNTRMDNWHRCGCYSFAHGCLQSPFQTIGYPEAIIISATQKWVLHLHPAKAGPWMFLNLYNMWWYNGNSCVHTSCSLHGYLFSLNVCIHYWLMLSVFIYICHRHVSEFGYCSGNFLTSGSWLMFVDTQLIWLWVLAISSTDISLCGINVYIPTNLSHINWKFLHAFIYGMVKTWFLFIDIMAVPRNYYTPKLQSSPIVICHFFQWRKLYDAI